MYGGQQPTQVRSRACGAAGDLKQSKAKQNSTVILDAATVPLSIRPAHSLPRVWQFEGFHRTIHRTSIAFPITLSGHPLLLHRLTARFAPEGRQLHTSLCSLASLVHIIRQENSVPDDRCAFISTADDLIANDPIALSSQPRAITGRWLFILSSTVSTVCSDFGVASTINSACPACSFRLEKVVCPLRPWLKDQRLTATHFAHLDRAFQSRSTPATTLEIPSARPSSPQKRGDSVAT
jgi:hypothetical protein